jgi:hypothetical protein
MAYLFRGTGIEMDVGGRQISTAWRTAMCGADLRHVVGDDRSHEPPTAAPTLPLATALVWAPP